MHDPATTAATLAAPKSLNRFSSLGKASYKPIFEGYGSPGFPGSDAGSPQDWVSVRRDAPCPICGKPDWCRITADRRAVLCNRSDGTTPAGWRHIKASKGGGHLFATLRDQDDGHAALERVRTPKMPAGHKLTTEQCTEILANGRGPGWQKQVRLLAEQLHVSMEVLEHLGVGWRWGDVDRGQDLHAGDWIYPMRDGLGLVVGVHRRLAVPIQKRRADGRIDHIGKLMVQGSRLGLLFAPELWQQGTGPILLPEGMTDTAALMHMGQAAVGRPSDRGGIELLATLLREVRPDRQILVVGENDRKPDGTWPGATGAEHTAKQLADSLGRQVLWACVPEPSKDSREHLTQALLAGEDPAAAGRRLVAHLLEHATTMQPAPRDPTLDGTVPPGEMVTMEQLRAELRAKVLRLAEPPLLRRLRPDAEHPEGEARLHPAIYLCQAPTGVGKSRAALELTLELERLGLRVAYLSQTHKQSAERIQEAEQLGLGGGAADPEITPQTCGLWGAAKRVRACGLSVQQVLCPNCPLKDTCAFQQAKAEARDAAVRFACHAQGAQDLARVAEGRDALIIDEDAVGATTRSIQVRPKHLLHVLRCLRTSAKAHPKLMDAEAEHLIEMCTRATEALLRAVRQSKQPGAVRIDTSGLAAPPTECSCGDLRGRKHGGQTCPSCGTEVPEDVNWSGKVWRLLGNKGDTLPPTHAMQLLLDLITGRITEIWCTHDLQATGAWDRQLVGIQRHRLPHKLVLLCDATADRATLEQVIGASGTTWTRRLMSAVQVISPEGRPADVHDARRLVPAGGDILVGSTPERATEALRGLLARIPEQRLGLICHGGHLAPMFGPEAEGGGLLDAAEVARFKRVAGHHTADVRGSNSWIRGEEGERIDAVIVEGCPNVPWAEVRRRLLLTGQIEAAAQPDGGWARHQVLSTTPEGDTLTNPTMAHTDPVWQEARRQLVHAALMQDLGRARHTLPEGCRVYAMTCEPMPGILTDPTPVRGIDEQTHYLMLEVVRLSTPQEDAAEAPGGTVCARIKSHKYNMSLGEMIPAPPAIIGTSRLVDHLVHLGWSEATAKRALANAASLGILVQPERGLWALPTPQRPGVQQEATQPQERPSAPERLEVRPAATPAVVISTACPVQQELGTQAHVMAEALEQLIDPPGDPVQEVVRQPVPPAASSTMAAPSVRVEASPEALAWLASSTPDEFATWQERAAIMQHDGGLEQRHAEVLALVQLWAGMQQATPRAGPCRDHARASPTRAGPVQPRPDADRRARPDVGRPTVSPRRSDHIAASGSAGSRGR